MKYYLGYDHVCILKDHLYYFLLFVKEHHISFYSLSYELDYCHVYIPVIYRYKLKQYQYPYHIYKTIGFISYLFILLKNIKRIIFLLSFIIFLLFYNQIIFKINIDGLNPSINKQLIQTLKSHDISIYHKQLDYESLNDLLLSIKEEYNKQIEYLNIFKQGSCLNIEYVKRNQINENKDSYKPIYAKEKGIIYKIDVAEGLVKVKVNDYVNKGDLLVDNNIITTNNKIQIIPVEGKIYAYTFKTYSASCKYNKEMQSDLFYKLLFEIRKQLPMNAYIDKENVLQMEVNHSKISLMVQYTLIEDISMQGEKNEGNH